MRERRRSPEALRAENAALRRALRLLHDVANLVEAADDPEATAYAILTGVTAGVGLGMNRAMIFERDPAAPGVLVGRAAIGPATRDEADRVWRSIESEKPDLETLYESGLRTRHCPSELDRRVRATRVIVAAHPDSAVARAAERVIFAEGSDDLDGLLHPATTLAAPMRGREGMRGVLLADNCWTEVVPTPVSRLVFTMVADHAGRALWAADRWAQVAAQARTDALTGLDTRRVGLALLDHIVAGALAGGPPVALLLLDLDRFKDVNDVHGHLAGDAVLAEVARRIRAALDRGARAFRYGGEEIGVILDGLGGDEAALVGERVRRAVSSSPVALPGGGCLTITCSLGLAATPPLAADAALLLRSADDALLLAKRHGRDRVVRA